MAQPPGVRIRSEFADELDGRAHLSVFGRIYEGDPPNRIIGCSEHFVAFVDLAPLVPGHLLVVPRRDVPSFAALPDRAWADWVSFRKRLADRLTRAWTRPVAFEHGSVDEMRGGACITHAHLHLLPAPVDIHAELRRDGLKVRKLDAECCLRSVAALNRPYFYVGDGDGDWVAMADAPVMPSQYLRRAAARQLGLSGLDWDWGVSVRREYLRLTVEELRAPPLSRE